MRLREGRQVGRPAFVRGKIGCAGEEGKALILAMEVPMQVVVAVSACAAAPVPVARLSKGLSYDKMGAAVVACLVRKVGLVSPTLLVIGSLGRPCRTKV